MLIEIVAQRQRKAEVQKDCSPFGGDEHVRRLDVAVQFSGEVQCVDSFRELAQCAPKPRELFGRRQRLGNLD